MRIIPINVPPSHAHRLRGCPFITNVDGEDFIIDGFMKYDGYGDECKELYFAGHRINHVQTSGAICIYM